MTQEVPLDHTQDASRSEVHRLTQLYPPPAYVKTASHEQLFGPDDLPVHVHAHPAKKLYRSHSKAATWMSSCFFGEHRDRLHPDDAAMVERQLRKFAAYHQILPDVEELWGKIAEGHKTDISKLSDDEFALVWLGEDNRKVRSYTLRNPAEVKVAAEWFGRYYREFTPEDRRQIAGRILKRAETLGVTLTEEDTLCKAAGLAISPLVDIVDAWRQREILASPVDKAAASAAREVAVALEHRGTLYDKPELLQKIAAEMEEFDRKCGLLSKYATGELAHPHDVCFAITKQAATAFVAAHVQTLSGAMYAKEALAAITPAQMREWLGDAFTEQSLVAGEFLDTEKLAEHLLTLPRSEAAMFDRLAAAAGIHPVGVDKAAGDFGFTQEQLAEMAAATI